MSDPKPSIGCILIFTQPESENPHNGHRDHPCVITKVWSDDCVNVKVLPDCAAPYDSTSCQFSTGRVAWPARV